MDTAEGGTFRNTGYNLGMPTSVVLSRLPSTDYANELVSRAPILWSRALQKSPAVGALMRLIQQAFL
jgi:hypothetical protein